VEPRHHAGRTTGTARQRGSWGRHSATPGLRGWGLTGPANHLAEGTYRQTVHHSRGPKSILWPARWGTPLPSREPPRSALCFGLFPCGCWYMPWTPVSLSEFELVEVCDTFAPRRSGPLSCGLTKRCDRPWDETCTAGYVATIASRMTFRRCNGVRLRLPLRGLRCLGDGHPISWRSR
jgi:hypothetical protein